MASPGFRWRPGLPVALFMLLASVYMLTWSGRINSNDALLMVNASSSLVRFGDMRADLAAGNVPPAPGQFPGGPAGILLPAIDVEPLQPVLAAPLYWLASRLPGPGLVHSVFLFNVIVCAAAGSLFFCHARLLGHGEGASLLASLLLGFGTIVWTYSDSFFQAPLAMLAILLAGYQLEHLRRHGWRRPLQVLLLALTLVLMPLARQSTLLAVPALVIIAAPVPRILRGNWRRLLPAAGLVLAAALVALLMLLQMENFRIEFARNLLRLSQGHTTRALHGYLISPGGSLWGTSPVLLLALPGAWMLWRAGQRRRVLASAALLASFALAFAFWQGLHWFGGLSWPPRFLIPVVPFVLLAALPVLEKVVRRPRPRWLRPVVTLLVIYSLWVQASAISLPWEVYGTALPPEAKGLGDWNGGLNLLRWLRWVVIPGLWPSMAWDFAWIRMQAPAWPLLFGGTALYAAWQLRRHTTSPAVTRSGAHRLTTLLHLAALPALMFFGLSLLPPDPLYDAPNEAMEELLQHLERESVSGDLVLLSDLELERYLANHAKVSGPRLVSLPWHPGERGSLEQALAIASDNPEILLHASATQQIAALSGSRDRIWLLTASGPWLPWAVRPVERYLARNHYPLREIESGPRARLLEYDTFPAPDPLVAEVPDWRSELRFGEHVALYAYSLPRGRSYQPGDSMPVTLFWLSDDRLQYSWTVALFLAAPGSPPAVQGWDSAPQAGLAPMTEWAVGVTYADNRALRLPRNLPPGEYQMLVVLYRVDEAGQIVRLPVLEGPARNGSVGVLPVPVQVGQGA